MEPYSDNDLTWIQCLVSTCGGIDNREFHDRVESNQFQSESAGALRKYIFF